MKHRCFFSLVVLALLAGVAHAQRLVATADHPDGVYRAGETVRWQIRWEGTTPPPASVEYAVKKGGLTELTKGTLTLTDGKAEVAATFDAPGTLLLALSGKTEQGLAVRGRGGAVASPEKVTPSAKRPADFDAFWETKLKELKAVPANPKLEQGEAGKPGVDYYKVTMDNIQGTHIQGQLARPSEGKKLPALLIVQWAGVYGLPKSWATDRAAEGWLVLNINAHDLPIDQPTSFYQEQQNGALKNYPAIGNESRDTSYFLRMYLSCYRAAQYLVERPDWDGKTLVVMGTSQGGLQALMTAGFHPKITAALANVPAGCDMLGPEVGRAPGWPQWYFQTAGKDEKKVRDASRYFDVVNFASRIRCPVLIGCGLIDETCPPEGIIAAANAAKGPVELVLLPQAPHQDEYKSHTPYNLRCWNDWLPALRQGKPAPVQRLQR